jgi:uncharacterized membrane protein YozB (DUF420 family)
MYAPLAVLAALIALTGFWPTYFGPLFSGATTAPPFIHAHTAVFVLWLALFIAQAVLAANGRIDLHIRLGRWIMVYAVFLVVVALGTAYVVFQERVAAGNFADAARRLFAPVRDMVCFVPFLLAGWIYRNKPDIHKRLMLTATTILLVASVTRMIFLGGRPVPLPQMLLVWLAPIYLAMAWDWFTRRMVHPVYLIGIAVMVAMRLAIPLRDSEAWLTFCRWLALSN